MRLKRKPIPLLAGAWLLMATAALGREYYQYNATNNWTTDNYVNFYTSAAAGTDQWPMYSFNGQATPQKYAEYRLQIASGTACYEIETIPTDNDKTAYDSRIYTSDGTFRSLDDDSGQGNYSKARVFLSGSAALPFYFAAYNENYNTMRFEYTMKRLNVDEATCTTGQSLPWVKKIGSVTTFSANAN